MPCINNTLIRRRLIKERFAHSNIEVLLKKEFSIHPILEEMTALTLHDVSKIEFVEISFNLFVLTTYFPGH